MERWKYEREKCRERKLLIIWEGSGKMEVRKEKVEGEKIVYRVRGKRKGGCVKGRSGGRENCLPRGKEWKRWKCGRKWKER